ncbi:MAG: flavodoxin-dependent (E)-4-hydroxy-3-methylbut-2-enyl-diphosphate synthase [Kiritimatiellae bacterium]|nr:flavodoxin-dependent (E)-4-hydroxy-3-methylbut-2-enyl-diphosphate synthase [Kiritimatiellia bacterium]
MGNRLSRKVSVGRVDIGGGAGVSVQSMSNADPHDAAAIIAQAEKCERAGCDIFRLTVPDAEAAKTLGEVKKAVSMPIVADIHFDWRLALAAIDAGCDALRLNPGNIGSPERVRTVASAASARGVPIRVGVNLGSLEKDLDASLRSGRISAAEALAASAMRHVGILEEADFRDVVISAKASNVLDTVAAYRLLAEKTDIPLHVGVTEAGTTIPGAVRSSVAMGILLSEGIGDTVRVSLTAAPEKEVKVALEILRSLGLRENGPSVTSCPTCGRTRVPLERVAAETEAALEELYLREKAQGKTMSPFPRVAVMGCAVNGPGEAKGADVALCGGNGDFVLFVKGKQVCRVCADEAAGKVVEHVACLR